MFQLDRKIDIVTEGGRGISKTVVLVYAKQNADAHVIDVNKKAAKLQC